MKFARTVTKYLLLTLSRLTLNIESKHLTQRYCKNLVIKLVFAPYKIKNLFSAKDAIFNLLQSLVVYKFSCAGCSTCYVDETNRHLATCVREHLTSNKNSHIFQHSYGSETCRDLCSENCFLTANQGGLTHRLGKPSLNKQVNHVNLTLSF